MQKNLIILGIGIFLLVTVIVLATGDSTQRKKVQFTNQNFVIKNENTEIKSEDLNINLNKTNIANNKIETQNKEIAIAPKKIEYKTLNPTLNNTSNEISSEGINYSTQNTNIDDSLTEYEKQKARLDSIENSLQKNKLENQRTTSKTTKPRYLVRNIDWNTWKSDFVNEIIDGSMSINSLNYYPEGSWFYYSFKVNKQGEISNIKVLSMQINDEDKQKIENLIKSYQYKDITVFPANSRRETAKVDAVVMFGSSEKRAKPTDFNDSEQVKIKLP